jgi:hypothetical protein
VKEFELSTSLDKSTRSVSPDGPAPRQVDATQDSDLRRRRHAVNALAAFGLLFFVVWISVNVIQAVVQSHGLGFGDGHVQPGQVGDQAGHGWLGDTAVLAATMAVDALLVGAWVWMAPRLRIVGGQEPSPEDVAQEDWYVLPIPNLTRVLVGVGIACAVGVSVCGAVILPVILIRYGW